MTAFEFLKYLKDTTHLPVSTEGRGHGQPSNSEIKRWLIKHSVVINGKAPEPDGVIEFPIRELVFFPNGKRRTTYVTTLSAKADSFYGLDTEAR